jgi:protocatechuate 3,4-dioxygenase beta subunit
MIATPLMIVFALLGSPAAAGAGQAPARPALAQDAGESAGVIRGVVTDAATGKPLRRARIRVFPDAPDFRVRQIVANTNSRGQFEVKDVPPGFYLVSGARAGYIDIQYGQRRAQERGVAVEVRGGQTVERINLALPRGGILAGRVSDDLGEAYPGVRVDALGTRYDDGKRQTFVAGTTTTDDLGQFRLSGLPPGSYYVAATSAETWRNDKKKTIGYATTYYPGGPVDQAQLLTLAPSEHKRELHLSLQAGRAASISGRVVRASGEPVPGASVGMAYSYPGVIMVAGMRSVRAGGDGTFTIKDVPGGVYGLSSGGDSLTLTVTGADVDDVLLTQRVGSTVTGVVLTDEDLPPPFPTSGVRVFIETPGGKVLPTVRVVDVAPDWTFKMQSLGGPFLFRMTGLPDDWMLAKAELDEKNVSDEPWDVPTGGREFTGLTMMLTRKIGRVAGTVVDANGRATSAATVVLFPEDDARWLPASRFIRSTRPGADGRFAISQLLPGAYHAVALEFVEDGQWEDPAFLAKLRETAERFVLAEGGSHVLTLKLPTPSRMVEPRLSVDQYQRHHHHGDQNPHNPPR